MQEESKNGQKADADKLIASSMSCIDDLSEDSENSRISHDSNFSDERLPSAAQIFYASRATLKE